MNSHSSHSPPAFLLFTTHNSSLQSSPGTGIFFVCQGCCSVPDNATYDRWGSVLCDEAIHCLWLHLDQSPLLGNWLLCYELSITNTSVVLEIVYQEKNITFRGVFFFFFSEPAVSSVLRRISGDIIPQVSRRLPLWSSLGSVAGCWPRELESIGFLLRLWATSGVSWPTGMAMPPQL